MRTAKRLLLTAKIFLLRRGAALEVPGGGGGSSGGPQVNLWIWMGPVF